VLIGILTDAEVVSKVAPEGFGLWTLVFGREASKEPAGKSPGPKA
jgi:hypothetical protein